MKNMRIKSLGLLFAMAALIGIIGSASGCQSAPQRQRLFIVTEGQLRAVEATSDEEGEIERGVPPPGAPRIVIDVPEPESKVMAPVPVSIRFLAETDAEIVPESLRVRFGFFDITDKVRDALDVSKEGITGRIEDAYPGNYKFTLEVSDTLNRTGLASIRFKVVETP